MAKFELTKSIEAVKLNQRTLRPLNQLKHTIPYGAVLEDLTLDRDMQQFHYLGEPYECPEADLKTALRETDLSDLATRYRGIFDLAPRSSSLSALLSRQFSLGLVCPPEMRLLIEWRARSCSS